MGGRNPQSKIFVKSKEGKEKELEKENEVKDIIGNVDRTQEQMKLARKVNNKLRKTAIFIKKDLRTPEKKKADRLFNEKMRTTPIKKDLRTPEKIKADRLFNEKMRAREVRKKKKECKSSEFRAIDLLDIFEEQIIIEEQI